MSVITVSQSGDPIVFLSSACLCEEGIEFEFGKAKDFEIGDVVYFLDFYKDEDSPQDHLSWMVKFRADDGKVYSATQTYFICLDEWNDIKVYFKSNLFQSW